MVIHMQGRNDKNVEVEFRNNKTPFLSLTHAGGFAAAALFGLVWLVAYGG